MSMDFVYDLKEKLEEQNMEYAICIIKPLKKRGESKIDIFYSVHSDDSFMSMCDAFSVACGKETEGEVDIEYDSDSSLDDEATPEPTRPF